MTRCVNNGIPMNHGSVFTTLSPPDGDSGEPASDFDGEPLCEVCAEVNGVPMWVTPVLLLDTETQEMTTVYLNPLGQEIEGSIVLADDPTICASCSTADEQEE